MSTTEAEYISASFACRESVWLQLLLSELGSAQKSVTIKADNQGAIKLIKNPVVSSRSKHIDVMFHFIREHVEFGTVEFEYIHTSQMVADILTKPVPKVKHEFCCAGLGLV